LGRRRWLRAALFAAAAAPALWLAWAAARGGLGANPIETITHTTGSAALRCLLATLAVTPLRRFAGWHALAAQRRMLGLFAFFYASLHFLTWSLLDLGLDLEALVEDVAERPYVTAGFTAFLLLVPLAITSTRGWVRRLGRRWVLLHRLAYVSAGLAIVHYLWLVKADLRPPLAYGAVLALLLAARLPAARPRSAQRRDLLQQ
jgi:sulfoxide reductase heme-binding subunit YedZ